MLRPRHIAGFLLRFALLYAVSMAPWPGLVETYGRLYRTAVQVAIISADPEHSVVVARAGRSARADTGAAMDTHILTRVPGRPLDSQEQVLEWVRSSRYTGYVPFALTMTLILATPLPWRRRAAALCWGGLLVTLFVAFAPGFEIYPVFDRRENHLLFEYVPQLYPPWRWLLQALAKICTSITSYYLVPVLIWIVVAFRREEWMSVAEQLAAGARPARTDGA